MQLLVKLLQYYYSEGPSDLVQVEKLSTWVLSFCKSEWKGSALFSLNGHRKEHIQAAHIQKTLVRDLLLHTTFFIF